MVTDAHKEPADSKDPLFIQVWLENQKAEAAQSESDEQDAESIDAGFTK